MQWECPLLSSSQNTNQYYRYVVIMIYLTSFAFRGKRCNIIQYFRIATTRKAFLSCVLQNQPALLQAR